MTTQPPPYPLVELHRFRRSRLNRLGVGVWYCGDDGHGPALKEGPRRVNGVYVNTPRGVFGVSVRRRPVARQSDDPAQAGERDA